MTAADVANTVSACLVTKQYRVQCKMNAINIALWVSFVCVSVCGGDCLCYDTCTLTSVDRGGYQVTARRRCVGSNTLTLAYPGGFGYRYRPYSPLPWISVFFILDGFSNIKLVTLIVVLPCILISTKLFYQQMRLLLKHKMLQFIFKISFLIWLLHVSVPSDHHQGAYDGTLPKLVPLKSLVKTHC